MADVLIVGGNRGIGLALVHAFQARGDKVTATCRTTSPELEATGATVVQGIDVARDEVVETLKSTLSGQHWDILVCNAGVLHMDDFDHLDYGAMRQQFEVNSLGPLRVVDGLRANLRSGDKVAIITSRMGSIADNGSGRMYGYRASKAAVNMIGKSLAQDLAPRGVMVQLLHPGAVRTEMTGGSGMIDADESAAGLLARIDEMTPASSGAFFHQNGEPLPW